jgi:putative SOS response-associated peptidase YedK
MRSVICLRSGDTTGNLPPLPAIFPDQMVPVVCVSEGERELTMMRWGMPNPPHSPASQRTSATPNRHTGGDGLRRKAGASCQKAA